MRVVRGKTPKPMVAKRYAPLLILCCLILLAVAPAWSQEKVWDGKAWVTPEAPEAGTAEADLAPIRALAKMGDNKAVVNAVEKFMETHPSSPAGEEALNLAGQAQMDQGNYFKAYELFDQQVATYPSGPLTDRALDRQYAIADAFLTGRKRKVWKIFRLSAQDEGIDILTRITSQAPGSKLAEKSLLRIADYYFADEDYPQAIDMYDHFVKQHPRSPKRLYAMLQAAKGCLLSFRGVQREVHPLLEARERFQVIAQAYPTVAKNENIPATLDKIHQTLAQKVFITGEFYEQTKHPRSAIFYYRRTLKQFPGTTWADKAKMRLEIMGPMPDPIQPIDTVRGDIPLAPTPVAMPARIEPIATSQPVDDPRETMPVPLGGAAPRPAPPAGPPIVAPAPQDDKPVRLEDLAP